MPTRSDPWKACLDFAALSDQGLRREDNQDAMATVTALDQAEWERRGHLFLVADGMGAHAAGETASQIAAECIPQEYYERNDLVPPEALFEAIGAANREIHDQGEASDAFRGMGTTGSALVLLPQGAIVAHVGDSRVYRYRGDRFEQLTFDHSLVWELAASGRTRPLPQDVPRNIITRSLGPHEEVKIDREGPFPVEEGDTFLLCSDGLTNAVADTEIGAIVGALTPEEAARALVDLANLRGGPDNITVIVVRVTGPQIAVKCEDGSYTQGAELEYREQELTARSAWPWWWAGGMVGLLSLGVGLVGMKALLSLGLMMALFLVVRGFWLWGRFRSGGRTGEGGRTGDVSGGTLWEHDGSPLGRGPYRAFSCRADGEFVERLCVITEQLRVKALNSEWNVDWPEFEQTVKRAADAAFACRYTEATSLYCRSLRFFIKEITNRE